LQARLGRWGAPFATSLLFALAHPNLPLHALAMGLVLAFALAAGAPLLSTSLAHALWNAGFLLSSSGGLP
jgi:membrane protease YdiL (CAAX protease family)